MFKIPETIRIVQMFTGQELIAIDSIRHAAKTPEQFEEFVYTALTKKDPQITSAINKIVASRSAYRLSLKAIGRLLIEQADRDQLCLEFNKMCSLPGVQIPVIFGEPECRCAQGHYGLHDTECAWKKWRNQ